MRTLLATLLGLAALLPTAVGADTAAARATDSRTEERTFASVSLDRSMHYVVYLPPNYDADPNRRYPVAYMLHGMGGSNSEWQGYGLFGAADELIKSGEIDPFLIVLPQGDQSYWYDHPNGGPRWGTYVARDVVGEIDGRYRTLSAREHRAVGGLSMGALGALQLGINFPDVFGVVGSHGPPLRTYEEAKEWLGDAFVADLAQWQRVDPIWLYATNPRSAGTLRLWIDVAADDETWRPTAGAFHRMLENAGVAHEFRVLPGRHDGDVYWRPHAPHFLRFYDRAFGRPLPKSWYRWEPS